jgi:hypothetical protein
VQYVARTHYLMMNRVAAMINAHNVSIRGESVSTYQYKYHQKTLIDFHSRKHQIWMAMMKTIKSGPVLMYSHHHGISSANSFVLGCSMMDGWILRVEKNRLSIICCRRESQKGQREREREMLGLRNGSIYFKLYMSSSKKKTIIIIHNGTTGSNSNRRHTKTLLIFFTFAW